MATLIDSAIILRLWDYSETSQIALTLTAEHGRVRLLARGIRRSTKTRFAPGLDLLEYGEATLRLPHGDSELGTLIGWTQREYFPRLRRSLSQLYGAMYAAELVAALTAELDPHPRLYRALLELLGQLDTPEADQVPADTQLAWIVRFQAELLRALGLAPNLRACTVCGRPRQPSRPAWFSAATGGFVCEKCQRDTPQRKSVPPNVLDADRAAAKPQGWFALLDDYLTYVAARPMRTTPALRACFARRSRESPTRPGTDSL